MRVSEQRKEDRWSVNREKKIDGKEKAALSFQYLFVHSFHALGPSL